mmetsp:Transcript_55983/g.149342  ORF Transcript_55983/g.149342 Transcript_55983/m.149342 type:complete len:157 (-) Transcript_55983:516-986(-)
MCLGQVLILDFPGVLLSGLMMCTFVVCALPDYFALNPSMMFGSMLGASDLVFGARWHEGVRRGPHADHDHHVLLFTPFYGAVFEDETIHAGELVSYAAMNMLGAAILGVCFLFFSTLQFSWVPPAFSPSSRLAGLRSSTIFSCGVMSTRTAALSGS